MNVTVIPAVPTTVDRVAIALATQIGPVFRISDLERVMPGVGRSTLAYALDRLEKQDSVSRTGRREQNQVVWRNLTKRENAASDIPRQEKRDENLLDAFKEDKTPATPTFLPSPKKAEPTPTFVPSPKAPGPWEQIENTVEQNAKILLDNPGEPYDVLTMPFESGTLVHVVRFEP